MSLKPLKTEIQTLIGAPCPVLRDRHGRCLFYCANQPGPEALKRLEEAGFVVRPVPEGLLIDLTCPRYRAFLQRLPLPRLREAHARSLFRMLSMHEGAMTEADIPLLRGALLLWDAGERERLNDELEAALAERLRLRACLPGGIARLVLEKEEAR